MRLLITRDLIVRVRGKKEAIICISTRSCRKIYMVDQLRKINEIENILVYACMLVHDLPISSPTASMQIGGHVGNIAIPYANSH